MIIKNINPGIRTAFIGDVIRLVKNPITPQVTYRSLVHPCPFSIPIPQINDMANPIYIMAYCNGIGKGLLDISSFTIGLFKLDKLVNNERTPTTIKIQAIIVIDFGLSPIFSSFELYFTPKQNPPQLFYLQRVRISGSPSWTSLELFVLRMRQKNYAKT